MQLHVTYKLLLQSNIKGKDPGSFIISTKNYTKLQNHIFPSCVMLVREDEDEKKKEEKTFSEERRKDEQGGSLEAEAWCSGARSHQEEH